MQVGKPFDMRFIDDRFSPRRARRGVIFPVIMVADYHAFRRHRRVIAVVRFIVSAVQQRMIF